MVHSKKYSVCNTAERLLCMEMKMGLETYLCNGVSCMDDRIYPKHSRHTRPIANIIPDSERVHDQ